MILRLVTELNYSFFAYKNLVSKPKYIHAKDFSKCLHSRQRRCLSSKEPDKLKKKGIIRMRFFDYLTRYVVFCEKILEKRVPKIFQMYKTFKMGFMDFIADLKTYTLMNHSMFNGAEWSSFKRKELEIYKQVPRDLVKFSPTLIISALPFTIYLILPVAYKFPTVLLTRHFWTENDHCAYMRKCHANVLHHYPTVLSHLRQHTQRLNYESAAPLLSLLQKINDGKDTSVDEILNLRDLFNSKPFELTAFTFMHRISLGRSLSLPTVFLVKHALLILELDRAIAREGLKMLCEPALNRACLWRGVDPRRLSLEERMDYLTQWLAVSNNIDEKCLSLLLHCHILLAYNHASNREVIRKIRGLS